jgi:hypothetical protein
MLVRYEDFVARPHETAAAMAQLAGQPTRLAASDDPHTVVLRPTHTVAGNDNRFRTGTVQLCEDTEWRSRLHRVDRAAVTTVCAPLLAHYGYPLLP